MSAPFFTTNDSAISQLEGLYIKERNPPATISGANLNQVCIVGETVRGPINKAVSIGSEGRFEEVFGGRDFGSGGAVANKVWLSLLNKPFGQLTVVRVAAAAATSAAATVTGNTFGTGSITVAAKSAFADGDKVTINDGASHTVDFVFKLTGGSVSAGQVKVDLTTATTAQDVANLLIAAIQANTVGTGSTTPCNVYAWAGAAGVVNVQTLTAGTAGNQTITKVSATGVTAVTGITGGAAGTSLLTVTANGPGSYGNNISVQVGSPSDGAYNHFNLTVNYLGKQYIYRNLGVDVLGPTAYDNTAAVLGTDDGNLVVLSKLASGVPAVQAAAQALTGGADGTVADSDYTTSAQGLNIGAYAKGCAVVMVAERSSATLKAYINTLASTVNDRIFLMCPDNETVSAASAVTEAASYRSDRIVYCFNGCYTLDPTTGGSQLTHPTGWMASILSQSDVDIHPGDSDNKKYTAGITSLYNENYTRSDYINFKAAGIAALEKDNGFGFVSGVTTSLVSGKTEITRRRMTDYLQLSVANTLKDSVRKKNTLSRRKANAGLINTFLQDLKDQERIVFDFLVDPDKLNTDAQRALGIERILMRVQLIGHILELVLETEIGTAVSIKSS